MTEDDYYYDKFKDYNQENLFEIIFNKTDYKSEIIHIVKQIITERGLTESLEKAIQVRNAKAEEEEQHYQAEIRENYEYYKSAFEIKKDRNSIQIRISDIPLFEGALHEHKIDFHREDKHVGAQVDSYPTQTYFFLNKDIDQVDRITKELKINTAPYADIRPFFKKELIITGIVLIVVMLILVILL
ncbi:MAG TPA: hypothetical protein VFF27_10065 [Bacteroidia bacterium]|jgi:hypothetical protein|nr:hypothetical protein [Bacteroidia bacterium]